MNVKLFYPVLVTWLAASGTAGRCQWPTDSSPDGAKGVALIRAGRLIDVRAGRYLNDQGILVDDGRIRDVGPYPQGLGRAPASALSIDLSQATVLPGLIDCHTHLLQNLSGPRGPANPIG